MLDQISYLLGQVNFSTLLDLAAVTLIFYWFLTLVQGTRAVQLVRGILILWLASILLSTFFQLTTLTWIIRNSGIALLFAIPIIFQPELRRALEQLGHTGTWFNRGLLGGNEQLEAVLDEIAGAANILARQKHGGLIVIERLTGLQDYADRGVQVDAKISRQLLVNIFYPNSPLHDGAVIIRNDRVLAAGTVLPLSDNVLGPSSQYGTRHRAGLGISEFSDALAIIVSEERGTISLAANGRLVSNLNADRLKRLLLDLLSTRSAGSRARRSRPVTGQ